MGLSMGENWNKKGFYKQEYKHLFANVEHACSLIGVSMGPSLVIHG